MKKSCESASTPVNQSKTWHFPTVNTLVPRNSSQFMPRRWIGMFWGWKGCHKHAVTRVLAAGGHPLPCAVYLPGWSLSLQDFTSGPFTCLLIPVPAVPNLGWRIWGGGMICGDTDGTASNPAPSCCREEERTFRECLGDVEHRSCRFPWKQDCIQGKLCVSATKPWGLGVFFGNKMLLNVENHQALLLLNLSAPEQAANLGKRVCPQIIQPCSKDHVSRKRFEL